MMKQRSGFTLLEVLLVLMILSVLMISSSQSIQQAVRSKIKIQVATDELSRVRDALKIMESDVNQAFHYRDIEKEMLEAVRKKRAATATTPASPGLSGSTLGSDPFAVPGGSSAGAPPCTDPNDPLCFTNPNRVDPTTHFIGKENEMYFASLNASRLSSDVRQADFIKVAYLIQPCRKPGSTGGNTVDCLVRRSSPVVEGDPTKGGRDIVLLENVKEFKLRYFGLGKQDWVTSWSSLYGDPSTKDKYPDAVEISLTVVPSGDNKEGKKKVSMQIVASVHQPNNPTK